jgi:predicted membrane channel-forming protein YqfA (hemolysin III family)
MLLHFDMPPDLLSYNLYDTQVYSDLEKGWFHQLWHILVLTATMTLYRAICGLIIWRIENETMCFP